jgi:Tol biopolymer transport system component
LVRNRTGAFVLLAAGCTLVAVVAVLSAVIAQRNTAKVPLRSAALAKPYVVFRSIDKNASPAHIGELTSTSAADPGKLRKGTGRLCERVYAVAAGGICVARSRSLTGAYEAQLLGPDGKVRHTVALDGIPSRARVSPDGRWGATTTFVTGHSYAKPGSFSTATLLIDMKRGVAIANLESFTVSDRGRVVDAADVQFWGITFAPDEDTFYATLATGGHTHLIKGSISRRTARVIHDNVECPSLSPDGTRIGYKQLVGTKARTWRLHVLDLATGADTALAETRSVDDQVEWLDDRRLLYHVGDDIDVVPADGSGAPEVYLKNADSPAVVR